MNYEYVVVPAPRKAPKVKGAKTADARFAHALTEVMNSYGAEGWEYLRSDTLPCEERAGLTGTKTSFQNVMVFRREIEADPYDYPQPDNVETPEQLAIGLQSDADRRTADPVTRPEPEAEPDRPVPTPQFGAHREEGRAPRLGPAAGDDRVARFPVPGAERRD
ncbi:DUF4177 domain-containing protein [Oceaniglobus indicus]|uniref:DUF4177 domain-containing protein n=1 Tax=Oceaniglobus indicus TaxID=2047749 RepID=UPI000C1831F8|nr:DUF4177 domain-containing protein [Oceaniglobus indicus]